MEIRIPNVMLSAEEVQALKPLERENYVRSVIKKTLTQMKMGLCLQKSWKQQT